ncbi:hypothetical protein Dsin_009951 [Dipteronia sinensis]|uniref:DUF1985 domain-containing protein n=1 Tax=Dipteronia sinensis TaxID=43782 RepID=A0AAE0ARH4_9ROSI|nr:hypothetical protein Dsin_009951 [Dipteronia sinensis]
MSKEFFNGRLCHILLCRDLNYLGVRLDEMWFWVGHHAVRFGKEEFLLITRLRFRPMPESVNSLPKAAPGSVHHRYFRGSSTPLQDILGKLRGDEFDEAEDVIKLGYVYFLSHIMLGQEYCSFVPDWLWGLVEDITTFEAFPKGTNIYIEVSMVWLNQRLKPKPKLENRNRRLQNRLETG